MKRAQAINDCSNDGSNDAVELASVPAGRYFFGSLSRRRVAASAYGFEPADSRPLNLNEWAIASAGGADPGDDESSIMLT